MPQLEKEQDFRDEKRKFVPSQDLAWMLGVLAGGGHVDKRGYVSVFGNEDPFLRIVDLIGTRLFRKNSVIKEIKRNRKGQAYKSITFYSKDLAVQIGDLRRDKYPTTIIEKHRWIVQDLKSTASFLSGILDTRGIVQVSPKAVTFLTSYPNVANFIAELLVRAGIENPVIKYKEQGKKIIGLGVYNIKDIKKIAEILYSRIPAKEEKLEFLRRVEAKRRLPIEAGQSKQKGFSDEEVIKEWLTLFEILGHIPRSHEIQEFKKQDKTKFSTTVYINRFGEEYETKSFRQATKRLMDITGLSEPEKDKKEEKKKVIKKLKEKAIKSRHWKKAQLEERLLKEWHLLIEKLGHVPTATEIARFKKTGDTLFAADTYAYHFGKTIDGRSFSVARRKIQGLIDGKSFIFGEADWRKVHSLEDLINEYKKAREICLKEKGRLPRICDILELKRKKILNYTAHTFANYFGERSFVRARENLERVLREREGESRENQGTQIFP